MDCRICATRLNRLSQATHNLPTSLQQYFLAEIDARPIVGDFFDQSRLRDELPQLCREIFSGIGAPMVEPQNALSIFSIIIKTAQIRYNHRAAGGHCFKRREA